MTTSTLRIDKNKGLLFPQGATGTVTGAIRVEEVYFEVSNSSTTEEGVQKVKTLNVSLKKLGGRKAFDIHLTRSGFKQDKAPDFTSNNFMFESVEYQVVGWVCVGKETKRTMISIAVNEVIQGELQL